MPRNDPGQALPVLRSLSTAVNFRALYPASHPRVVEGVEDLVRELGTCLQERGRDEITFLIIEQELLVDDRPIRAGHLYLAPLIRTLRGLAVQRLTIGRGMDADEAQHLVEGLASIGELGSTAHVVL